MRLRDVFYGWATVTLLSLWAPPAEASPDYVEELQTQARARRLARSRDWQVLGHYHEGFCGGWKSSADGPSFFLAGDRGASDPEAELLATIAAFATPALSAPSEKEAEQHPQCRFPARWSWLKQELGIDTQQMPEQPCPLFAFWRQAVAPEKVTLIYSAAYINSPASMYGHTFLRLSRRTGAGQRLIDYIVNFAADATTDNGFLYALLGLTGGFAGHFYVMPYYVKIQEYSNIESRDLWEYELALTPSEAERLLEHTWETRSTHFNYYFVTENCSYFLLELIEAARPSLHLSDRFKGPTIPTETLRAVLSVPGLVEGRSSRPSLRAQVLARKAALSREEIRAAESLAKRGRESQNLISGLPAQRQARAIDAANDLLRFREGLKKDPSPEFQRKERELLILRGRTGVEPLRDDARPASDAPETGHRALRLGASGGWAGSQHLSFEELSLRMALHDFLDPRRGYLDDAELEMLHLRLRFYNQSRKLFPERLDMLNILSVSGYDRWIPKTAWTVRAYGAQAHNLGCFGLRCSYGGVETGGGIALRAGRPLLFYLLTSADVAGGGPFQDHYRLGAGGFGGAVLRLGNVYALKAQARYYYYFLGDHRRAPVFDVGQSLSLGSWAELRLEGQAIGHYTEARAAILGYF